MAFDRWAVVRWVCPPPTAPASTTATDSPCRASRYAVVMPAMPAPTTQTSAAVSRSRGGGAGASAVSIQTDVLGLVVSDMAGLRGDAGSWSCAADSPHNGGAVGLPIDRVVQF